MIIKKNKIKKKIKQGGFALVITMLLSTVMLTVVTLASKEMVDEVRNSARLDNSLIAYYSAEAGVEDALLAYRHDKAVIIEEECRDVSTRSLADNAKCAANTTEKEHYYKLKVSNKTSEDTAVDIYKDYVYEISIPEGENSFGATWSSANGFRVEATVFSDTGLILDKVLTNESANTLSLSWLGGIPGKKIVRIRPWYTASPVPADSHISLLLPEGSLSGITKIESTGYYGNVARKIVAKIDNTSGSILNIFDFTIYSDTPLVK